MEIAESAKRPGLERPGLKRQQSSLKDMFDDRARLLRGEIVSIEKLEQTNVVRIFVSSTFTGKI